MENTMKENDTLIDNKSTISKVSKVSKLPEKKTEENSTILLIYNCFQLCSWSITSIYLFLYFYNEFDKDIGNRLFLSLKISQTSQYIEVLLSLFGFTKSSFFSSFLQVTARTINTYWLYNNELPYWITLQTLFAWCLTEIIRSLFYISKDSIILFFLRYNLFIILYPMGASGELFAKDNFLSNNPEYTVHIRAIQAVFIVGFLYLYIYMFRLRKKNMVKNSLPTESNEKSD